MTLETIPTEITGGSRFVLSRRDFVPAYLKAHEEGRLKEKVEEALSHLGPSCLVCPRLCKGVDRLADQFGVWPRRTSRPRCQRFSPLRRGGRAPRLERLRERSSSPGATSAACSARTTKPARTERAGSSMPRPWPGSCSGFRRSAVTTSTS